MKRYKFLGAALLGATIMVGSVTSCSDSGYLDINYNPDYPTTANYKQLFPAAEASTVAVLGLYGQLTGNFWCQYATQGNSTNQYNTLANYSVTTSSSYPPVKPLWDNTYANALKDLKLAVASAEGEKVWNYWMVSKILMAYNYLVLTDTYGDIPFSESLDIEETPNPIFEDSKTVVYPGIISMLDEAIAKYDDAVVAEKSYPIGGTLDCFLGGNLAKWKSFAKSLKLKMYLKDFETHKADVESLLSEGDLLEDDCAWTAWTDATNKANPLYEYNIRQLNTTENMRACHTFVEYLLANRDPRIVYLYEQTAVSKSVYSNTEDLIEHMDQCYEGLPCGTKPSTSIIKISQSSRVKQAYNDPVYLMNKAECELMISEAYARLNNVDKAEEYYNKGILAGFDRWGLDGTDFVTGVYKFDKTDMLKSIARQYWLTYAGANSYDGWLTRNRLGYPEVQGAITVRKSNKPGERTLSDGYKLGNLVDPGASNLATGGFPMRLIYPTSTSLYNTAAIKYIKENGNDITKKLWWEK